MVNKNAGTILLRGRMFNHKPSPILGQAIFFFSSILVIFILSGCNKQKKLKWTHFVIADSLPGPGWGTGGPAMADLDGDGDLDLISGNAFGQTNRLYLNDGSETPFTNVTGSDVTTDVPNTTALALGDADGDDRHE